MTSFREMQLVEVDGVLWNVETRLLYDRETGTSEYVEAIEATLESIEDEATAVSSGLYGIDPATLSADEAERVEQITAAIHAVLDRDDHLLDLLGEYTG